MNEREEFTTDEQVLRQDPTFGFGEINPNVDLNPGVGKGQVDVVRKPVGTEVFEDEDDEFWYG